MVRNLIHGIMGWWLLWESRRELEPTTKQDYRRDKTPCTSIERKNRSQKGWVTSHGPGLGETHLAEASSFCCVFPPPASEAPVAACCLRQDTGLGGHTGWPAYLLLHVSDWSASPSSVRMGWQQKFCPAAHAVLQKVSFLFSLSDRGGTAAWLLHMWSVWLADSRDSCSRAGDISILTGGIVLRNCAENQLELLFSAELPTAKTWSWLGLRKKQPSEIRKVRRAP